MERFSRFAAVCTHKYASWLRQDNVFDFVGARACFDKYELAESTGSDVDEGIAVSAAVANPEPRGAATPPDYVAGLQKEMRDNLRRQEESFSRLNKTVELLAVKTERVAGSLERPYCTGCNIVGHTLETCRWNPSSPNYKGRRTYPVKTLDEPRESHSDKVEDPAKVKRAGGEAGHPQTGRMTVEEISSSGEIVGTVIATTRIREIRRVAGIFTSGEERRRTR